MLASVMKKCCFIPLLALLWALGSAYWYTCQIKYACAPTQVPVAEEKQMQPLTVYFGIDSDNIITEGIDADLHAIAQYLATVPGSAILITGHTNVHSDHEYTDQLGLDRADKVKSLLVSYGAPEASITTVSKGQNELAGDPSTEEGQALNRRAVITQVK